MGIAKKVGKDQKKLIGKDDNTYKILKDYKGTYIEKQLQAEEKMVSPILRVFESAKPSSGRRLNVDPTHTFDPYKDSVMDYASIIGDKLRKPWESYNRLISVHIPLCPNECWHCYLPKELYVDRSKVKDRSDDLSASGIIDIFKKQRESDDGQGKESNVLRITGGEPFLVPKLILGCLEIINDDVKLKNEIFIWTETNLEPFIGENGKAFMDRRYGSDQH